jgi:hypothetical protein
VVLIAKGIFIIEDMGVSLSQSPGQVFSGPAVKEKLFIAGPALPVKPYPAFVGYGSVRTVTVKAPFFGKGHQFIGVGGYFDGPFRGVEAGFQEIMGKPGFIKERPIDRLLPGVYAFIPYQAVMQNIIMIDIKGLGSGFDMHRFGEKPVYILGAL